MKSEEEVWRQDSASAESNGAAATEGDPVCAVCKATLWAPQPVDPTGDLMAEPRSWPCACPKKDCLTWELLAWILH